ncbi:MAG: hypothetical protein EBS42_12665, partial [Caulobacteraceae bacterium]|nr:hypothetical protein [Caulobacteraceae bacterium]
AFAAALAFAPLSLEDETRRLAVAGRVDALPRLSGLLRAIAGGIAALRRREAGADPETLLARLGEAYALSLALENLQDPDTLNLVMGVVRQRYDPIGRRTLFGLGARLWETDGGAHGVTAYFHDPEHDRDFRLSQARADRSDVTFTAEEAFRRPIWGAPMSHLAVSEVALRDGAASASGRLSTGQATTATTGAWTPRPEGIRNWRCAADDWQALETRLQGTFAPGLARPRIEDTAVILVQTRTAPLRFDDLTQSLIWPVADSQGRWIGLTLPYEGIERARIEALERQAQATRFWAILAIAQPVEDRFELHPYGLWADRLVMLDFDREDRRRRSAAITPAAGLGLIERLKGLGGRKAGDNLAFRTGGSPTSRALDEAWALLLRRAELGQGQSDATFASQAQALADRLNSVGLTFPGRQFHALPEAPSPEEACLAAAWAITLTRRSRTTLPWMT